MTSINFQYFPDLFSEIVTKAHTLIQADSSLSELPGIDLGYEFGTLHELQKRVLLKNSEMYPLVWLVWERPENLKKFNGSFSNRTYNVSPLVFIIEKTDPNYTSSERYENIFKPFLIPIYDNILKAIGRHRNFNTLNTIDHEQYEHFFWGMDEDNNTVLSDYNDAIELKLIDLEILKKC